MLKNIKKERADVEKRPQALEAVLESMLFRITRIEQVVFGPSANESSSLKLSKEAQSKNELIF